ncbi:MAG TPA: c-type cytochrome biogenesis protein CcmI [Gammaproteobacteria bacterium]|nr:c-type cytochrome biogenesis protein CcmI [Gammaproteobacteria bacterium]
MLIFWFVVCVMMAVALFFVLRPLFLRKPPRQGSDRTDAELAVYRNRMAELKAEVENGLLSEAEAAMAEIELKKSLLHEAVENKDQEDPSTRSGSSNWWTIGIASVLLPVIAISAYLFLGNPHLTGASLQPDPANPDTSGHQFSTEDMVAQLAERLENNPDDPQGWLMLTNSYMTLGRYQDAVKAGERMYALYGNEPYIMLRYADALAMANNGRLSGKPAELIKKALALEPDNITGLWLAGMVEDQQANYSAAIEYWQRLQPLLQNDQKSLEEVNQLISRAQAKMGGSQQIAAPAGKQPETGDTPRSIVVDVSLSPDLAGDTDPDDALFVYARAVEGPPMPLAVVRKKVKNLPLQVTLDDSMAMFPQMKLSSFDQVKVSARISKTGNAITQPGDFIGESPVITNNKQPDTVSIVINKQVP